MTLAKRGFGAEHDVMLRALPLGVESRENAEADAAKR